MKLSNISHASNTVNKMAVKNIYNDLNSRKVNRLALPLALVIILLIILLFIEYKHPYFFLQDDNRDYFLPYFVHNFDSLLKGEIPLYNFHQFLGAPSLSLGQSAALYPITYISVFLSNLVFGHYFAAVDIQVILQLLIGAVGFYNFIRFFDIDRKIAFFAGLTWPLSSFIIYVSNSWIVVAAVAAYFPWMLLLSFRLYKTPTLKATIYAVTVRLLLFYAGHIQYFIYSVIFEFITITLYVLSDTESGEKHTFKFLKKYIESYIYVFIFALPLLLPMWHQTTISVQRSGPLPLEMFASQYFPMYQLLKGLIYPFMQEYVPFNMLNLSHIGYLTIIFMVIGIVEKFIRRSKNAKIISVRLSVFVIPALIALLWATNLVFNLVIYIIPILNRFRWPFKLAFYLDFYLIVIATLMLSHIITRLSWKAASENILLCLIIMIQIFNFAYLYTASTYKDFGEHSDNLPLQEKLKDQLVGGRIISIGFDIWSPTPEKRAYLTAPSLGFNYATLWGLDYFAGYEPLISEANSEACLGLNFKAIVESDDSIPVDYFRKAAVKWYIVPKNKADEYSKQLLNYGIIEKYADENRVVFYDNKAYPMVFNSKGEKPHMLDYKVTTNTIELSVELQQSEIINFNNLYNPFFEGYIDGEKTKLTPNNDIHFSISVPKGKHHIMIRYRDPYFVVGTYLAIAFLIFLVSIWTIRYALKSNLRYPMTIESKGMKQTMISGRFRNQRTGQIVGEKVWKADSFWTRFRGLLGRPALVQGEGLWLKHCQQVHMIGMKFPLSVCFLDKTGHVCMLIDDLRPWKISPRSRKADSVIEFSVGWGRATNTGLGDELVWEENDEKI